jgi:hypothetical protein
MSAANVPPAAGNMAAAAAIAADFQAGIFFDNAPIHITQVQSSCPRNMLAVQIDETSPVPEARFDDEKMVSYLTQVGPNAYHRFLTSCGYVDDTYDPKSGIGAAHLATGRAWLADTAAMTPRVALFDWDRTISKIEGTYDLRDRALAPCFATFFAAEPTQTYQTIIDAAVVYLCGGAERLESLRAFMRELNDAGVVIFILTNNGNCGGDFYNDLVRSFFSGIPYAGVICSRTARNPSTYARGDKGAALVGRPRLGALCIKYGGARKKHRSTKKRHSSRRKRSYRRR